MKDAPFFVQITFCVFMGILAVALLLLIYFMCQSFLESQREERERRLCRNKQASSRWLDERAN